MRLADLVASVVWVLWSAGQLIRLASESSNGLAGGIASQKTDRPRWLGISGGLW